MSSIVDVISEKTVELVSEYILNSVKDLKKKELWKGAVKNACEATEGIEDVFADYILKLPAIQRHFLWLISNKSSDGVYRSFIITMAVELCKFNAEKKFAESLGVAILDNWFESNNVDYQDIRNQIAGDEIEQVIGDRERLYREFFLLYGDSLAKDTIRVYYPRNGERWIEWDKKCSVDVKVNLSRGTEFGFFRTGFSYRGIETQEYEKELVVAYINKEREILRFEYDALYNIDEKKLLWVQ